MLHCDSGSTNPYSDIASYVYREACIPRDTCGGNTMLGETRIAITSFLISTRMWLQQKTWVSPMTSLDVYAALRCDSMVI